MMKNEDKNRHVSNRMMKIMHESNVNEKMKRFKKDANSKKEIVKELQKKHQIINRSLTL